VICNGHSPQEEVSFFSSFTQGLLVLALSKWFCRQTLVRLGKLHFREATVRQTPHVVRITNYIVASTSPPPTYAPPYMPTKRECPPGLNLFDCTLSSNCVSTFTIFIQLRVHFHSMSTWTQPFRMYTFIPCTSHTLVITQTHTPNTPACPSAPPTPLLPQNTQNANTLSVFTCPSAPPTPLSSHKHTQNISTCPSAPPTPLLSHKHTKCFHMPTRPLLTLWTYRWLNTRSTWTNCL
jgi:hypothetical protein